MILRIKNKTPAPLQITSEQILREAREREDTRPRPPKQKITDSAELTDYRLRLEELVLRRRKEFEDKIRGAKTNNQVWVRYADWEESQKDHRRARSVWERALRDESYRNHTLWLKYADLFTWRRYLGISPELERYLNGGWFGHRINKLGSLLSNSNLGITKSNAQDRFTRDLCFAIQKLLPLFDMPRLCTNAPLRDVEEEAEMIFVAFAEFEEGCKEVERARFLYKFALDHIPKGRAEDLYKKFVAFEKQYGDKEGIDDAIVGERKLLYEGEVRKNPLNYDSWFDYIRLEETLGNIDRIRDLYERAIANVPPAQEKRYWQRYIYLWIDYALFEEIVAEDVERTRAVYRECLVLIPHSKFSFAKIWLLAAQFEIRQLNLSGARQILGNAIGKAPKHKIFKKYIEIELHLGNIDRCRKLYTRYLEWSPESCYGILNGLLRVAMLGSKRARAIFELAISQPVLDTPELLWKAYIDFEISLGELERTRALYERLLDRTKHYKVWLSFAKFEASAAQDTDVILEHARAIFDRANTYYKESKPELKEERAKLLEDWLNMEASFGIPGDVSAVQSKLPKKLKKRKPITREDGETEYEEYIDYLFPEESQTMNLKILEAAHKWKKQKVAAF
ncbi:hypothetical protein ARALYDRAFT_323672 [Arabidopsis lyrata subsp. lyrata]|uniref:Pre-mRNA-splicing factor Syf1-like N-terminal HAT-repeats domain-containing protein n=1 Tax=Arabidopsis lyrata subsp. lyrata TaxID=81972 RepID=D7LTN1_ARALL|nr:hypothetical protein ARALYDRAFT_323672 [Arabidopsis lyrata subsp. lyrata]